MFTTVTSSPPFLFVPPIHVLMSKIISIITFLLFASSANAAILSDSIERRIERPSDTYSEPSSYRDNKAGVTMLSGGVSQSVGHSVNHDSMRGLIIQKQREFNSNAQLSTEENTRVSTNRLTSGYNAIYNMIFSTRNYVIDPDTNTNTNTSTNTSTNTDFDGWLNRNPYRAQEVADYQRYLSSQVGAANVPPLAQLLTTARSWEKCGYEPYQLPPRELWSNMVPTLRLYSALKSQGVLPASTEIRSVYRSPSLNKCAGGADASKHMTAGAMDIWVPEYDNDVWRMSKMQDSLCQFWHYQGQAYNFGLGLYSTGAIHLDTQEYRKWGGNNTGSSSSCRY